METNDTLIEEVYSSALDCMRGIYSNRTNSDISYWVNAQYELHQYIVAVGYQKGIMFDYYNRSESIRRQTAASIMKQGLEEKQSATKLEGLMHTNPEYLKAKETENYYDNKFNKFKTLWTDLKDLYQQNIITISVLKQDKNFNQFISDKA